MGRFGRKAINRVLVVLLVVVVVGAVAQGVYIDAFNKTPHTIVGADETQLTHFKFSDRADSTSTWLKRDFDLNGKTVDLQAQTIDGTLVNNSGDTVESWGMTITIQGDCFVNNAWTGTVEIHQFVGTEQEAVQTLDLRSYDLGDVKLDYRYDGDLLIPLKQGDYIVYYPSEKDEFNIEPHAEMTMGMIFYYLDDLDLSNYTIEYYYHRDFTYGAGFIALVILAVALVLLFAGTLVADASYNRAVREMELRKSSLSSMSSIYSIISFIDLDADQIIPIYTDPKTKGDPLEGSDARKQLLDIFGRDTAESHRPGVLEFVDIGTLNERLDKESIACEYVSKAYGWSQVRFFAVDREAGQPLKRVLLTIQDINSEKQELERFELRSARVELESSTRNAFAAGASTSMRAPVQAIDELCRQIMNESNDEPVRAYAKRIRDKGKLLSYLIDGAVDSTSLSASTMKIEHDEYSLRETVSDARDIAFSMLEDDAIGFEQEIPPSVPDRLVGDERRVKQVLIGILSFASQRSGVEAVKVSVFGTSQENREHLLFSAKMTGAALSEDEAMLLEDFISSVRDGGGHVVDSPVRALEGVAILLTLLESELHTVNTPGEGCEFYFEIEQDVSDKPSPDVA